MDSLIVQLRRESLATVVLDESTQCDGAALLNTLMLAALREGEAVCAGCTGCWQRVDVLYARYALQIRQHTSRCLR